ncbi:MAG: hypothetical protein ACYTGR_16600 [Planctomycetota bacterium]
MTAATCLANGGDYQGDFSDCGSADCPQPIGGCCFPDGSCAEISAEDCAIGGGKFQGTGVPCEPNGCTQPAGGCCFPDGGCSLLTSEECVAAGGAYQGDDSDCQPGACPQPGPINDLCSDALELKGGVTVFSTIDADTDGDQHDACEFDGQTYHDIWYSYVAECDGDLTVTTCEDLGGSADFDTDLVVYLGDPLDGECGSLELLACNDDDPDNACGGQPDFHSTVVIPIVAGTVYTIRVGGWNLGDQGTGELYVECSPTTGACCFEDGTCGVLDGDACAVAGGVFEGNGTLCGEVDCPQPPACDEDVTGDGLVDVQDMVEVILQWGPCGDCSADVNDDGLVDVQDLVAVVLAWGNCP